MSMLGWGAVLTNRNILPNKVIDCSWNMISYNWEFRWGSQQEIQKLKNTRRWTLSARCVVHFYFLKLGPNSFPSDHRTWFLFPCFWQNGCSRIDSENIVTRTFWFGMALQHKASSIHIKVPVLRDGDFVLTESVAMLRYLAREKQVKQELFISQYPSLSVSIRAVVCNKRIRKGEKGHHFGLLNWRPCAC